MVSLYGGPASQGSIDNNATTGSPCQYNCSNTTNPANLRIIYTLNYVQRFYQCESSSSSPNKSKVSVKWTVSVPFNIFSMGINLYIPTGDIKFTSSAGATLLTLTAYSGTNPVITPLGADPACTQNSQLYEIKYFFDDVANTYFAAGNQIACSLILPNDCPIVNYSVASGYVPGPTFSQNAYLPCNRVDKVYITPGSTTVIGNRLAICTPPTGFLNIDYHQLEYRKANVGGTFWANQTSPVYWGVPGISGVGAPAAIFTPFNGTVLTRITAGSGTWLIRYRNVKTGTCNVINRNPFDFTEAPNPSPGDQQANGKWGNEALWVTEAYPF